MAVAVSGSLVYLFYFLMIQWAINSHESELEPFSKEMIFEMKRLHGKMSYKGEITFKINKTKRLVSWSKSKNPWKNYKRVLLKEKRNFILAELRQKKQMAYTENELSWALSLRQSLFESSIVELAVKHIAVRREILGQLSPNKRQEALSYISFLLNKNPDSTSVDLNKKVMAFLENKQTVLIALEKYSSFELSARIPRRLKSTNLKTADVIKSEIKTFKLASELLILLKEKNPDEKDDFLRDLALMLVDKSPHKKTKTLLTESIKYINKIKSLTGSYSFLDEKGELIRGKLTFLRKIRQRYYFRWQDPYFKKGILRLEFSNDFSSFKGRWNNSYWTYEFKKKDQKIWIGH